MVDRLASPYRFKNIDLSCTSVPVLPCSSILKFDYSMIGLEFALGVLACFISVGENNSLVFLQTLEGWDIWFLYMGL